MSLFRYESPNLGSGTTVNEISGFAAHPAGAPLSNDYKPQTRQVINISFSDAKNTGNLSCFEFVAPYQCQVVQAKYVMNTSATASCTLQSWIVPFASQPEALSSGHQVFAAAADMSSATSTAQTVFTVALTTSVDNLIMNPGDLLGYVIGAALTTIQGGLLQIEVVRL